MNPPTETVHVALAERSYDIEIGTDSLGRAGSFLAARHGASGAMIITDKNVEDPYAHRAAESLSQAKFDVNVMVVEPGESSKSVEVAEPLWDKMLELGADRRTVVVAVGGGVIGDLAGFVAATYARGVPLLQIPTTLLAQVDSSVGGKVGVNLSGAKNMVGAFWQPLGVLIDTAVLASLPTREYRAGLAEVVKYGVILDADFFAYLEDNVRPLIERSDEVLRNIVARSCRLKADVVEADEREEAGLRAVLNYGHTFCHALETLGGYTSLLHGEAVAIGMHCAARLAERMGRVDAPFVARQQTLLESLGLAVELPQVSADEMLDVMARDKKAEAGRLRFILPDRLGHVELVDDVAEADVQAVLGP